MRLSSSAAARSPAVVAILATALLLLSFAVVAVLHNRPQVSAGAAPGCPPPGARPTSSLVGASFSVSSSTATYVFDSLVDRSPSGGVPGLIEYCVILDSGASDPTNVTAQALGDNGSAFHANTGSGEFSFGRDDGEPSNIPLDGTTGIVMGTATWSGAVPSSQTILLHISDAAECAKLYPNNPDTSATCWVLPSSGGRSTPTPTATTTEPTPTATPILPPPDPTATGTVPTGK